MSDLIRKTNEVLFLQHNPEIYEIYLRIKNNNIAPTFLI